MTLKLSDLWHSNEQKTPKTCSWRAEVRPRRSGHAAETVAAFMEEVKSETVIMSSLHLFLPGGTVGTFHTPPFTHTVLCSVKLPSDVALSEQLPWGPGHLRKQKRSGGDMFAAWSEYSRRHALLPDCTHHSMIWEFIQSVSAKARRRLHVWLFEGKDVKSVCRKIEKSYLLVPSRDLFLFFWGGGGRGWQCRADRYIFLQ